MTPESSETHPAQTGPAGQAGTPPPPGTGSSRSWIGITLLVLLSLGMYYPTLHHELVYDDMHLISDNASVMKAGDDFSAAYALFAQEYWTGVNPDKPEALRTQGQALYRPLTLFMWACLYAWNGGVVPSWPYHLLSILMNALVVLLLVRMVTRLTDNRGLALATGLLFAVHPLHSEAAAYVAGLSDLMAAAAVFLGLSLFIRCIRATGKLPIGATLALLATFFIGMLAKEQTVLLLAGAALTDYLFTRSGQRTPASRRVVLYGGMLAMMAVNMVIRYAVIGYLRPQGPGVSRIDNPLFQESFFIRLVNGLKLVAMQVWLFLWPQHLSIDYSYNAIPLSSGFTQAGPLSAALLVLTAIVFGLVCMRRWPAVCWGVLFFLGCSLFTANILLPIGTIFGERLTYLPSAGAALAVAALFLGRAGRPVDPGSPRPASRVPALGLLLLLTAAGTLGWRTTVRNDDFRSSLSIFESGLEEQPNSARLHYQVAAVYSQSGFYSNALEHAQRAFDIAPAFVHARLLTGNLHSLDKNWDKALAAYDEVLAGQLTGPSEGAKALRRIAYTKRALVKRAMGKFTEATADLRLAMEQSGNDIEPYLALARLYEENEQPEEAIPILRMALARDPGHVTALYQLAATASRVGDKDAYDESLDLLEATESGRPKALGLRAEMIYESSYEVAQTDPLERDRLRSQAMQMFDEARYLDDSLATPYVYRGRFMTEEGRLRDAIIEYDRALERRPQLPTALILKARAQLDIGRPEEALKTLKELEPIFPSVFCYLFMADAYFMLGKPDEMETAYAKMKKMGTEPIEAILDRVVRLKEQNLILRAIEVVEMGLAMPDYASDARLLRQLGILQLLMGRPDEALASFDVQAEVEAVQPAEMQDAFLPINRARALLALDRDAEAAEQLDLFEATADPESSMWPSLLHRRAELFLKPGGPFYDPWQAEELCAEGLLLTRNRYDRLFLSSIEARAASNDLSGALDRAREARASFPNMSLFNLAVEALQTAVDGDLDAALADLRSPERPALTRVADALERVRSGGG